jgi:hypothetical protein
MSDMPTFEAFTDNMDLVEMGGKQSFITVRSIGHVRQKQPLATNEKAGSVKLETVD